MIAEIGVGLIAYFWAIETGFATDEIKDIVAAQGNTRGTGPAAGNGRGQIVAPDSASSRGG